MLGESRVLRRYRNAREPAVSGRYQFAHKIHNSGRAIVCSGVKETAELDWA